MNYLKEPVLIPNFGCHHAKMETKIMRLWGLRLHGNIKQSVLTSQKSSTTNFNSFSSSWFWSWIQQTEIDCPWPERNSTNWWVTTNSARPPSWSLLISRFEKAAWMCFLFGTMSDHRQLLTLNIDFQKGTPIYLVAKYWYGNIPLIKPTLLKR